MARRQSYSHRQELIGDEESRISTNAATAEMACSRSERSDEVAFNSASRVPFANQSSVQTVLKNLPNL